MSLKHCVKEFNEALEFSKSDPEVKKCSQKLTKLKSSKFDLLDGSKSWGESGFIN